MYGLPNTSSGELETKRDRFADELYDDCCAFRVVGWVTLPAGLGLVALAASLPVVTLGLLGGLVAGCGLIGVVVGSRWLANKNARDVYAGAIERAERREWMREFGR